MASMKQTISALFAIWLFTGITSAQLSPSFYYDSCPTAVGTIRTAITNAVIAEPRMGASLLRLHFHDCFVTGCDASVLLDDSETITGEQTAPPNVNSLRGFEVIDSVKATLETLCPGVVSCADILTLAARDSVVALAGESWVVPLGRRDSLTATLSSVGRNLPGPGQDLSSLLQAFSNKGFDAKELVALSGSHTIGQSRCFLFRNRIYNDTNIDAAFAASLRLNCPPTGSDGNLSPLDVVSPSRFDNAYFSNLLTQKGIFHSDQELFNGGSTDAQVEAYASDQAAFLTDFANAMVKMGNLTPLTGTEGEIRINCRRPNDAGDQEEGRQVV